MPLILLRLGFCLTLLLALACGPARADDYSPAERLLFTQEHLSALQPPAELRYAFVRRGSLEEPFSDSVSLSLSAGADGACCTVHGEFLSGARRLPLPDIDGARSNPVLLYFLERDVREMQRLTKGQAAHFRRMLRLAVAQSAPVRPVSLRYQEREVAGQAISVTPYADDPSRGRFERFAGKRYEFFLSGDVPGGVYGIRSSIGPDTAPLMVEELFITGATPP